MAKEKKKKDKKIDPKVDKDKEKLENFDPRGVQTLFRTLSRNHYNLLRMVDSKASIMLTVNSIIISLMMGIVYMAPETDKSVLEIGSKLLLNFGMASMVFALLAMLPHRYYRTSKHGYKGSLYAGNFSKLSYTEYQEEMYRIIKNGNNVYNEMINDLYHLGKSITWKQRLIFISVFLFLTGLVGAIIHTMSHGIAIEEMFFKDSN